MYGYGRSRFVKKFTPRRTSYTISGRRFTPFKKVGGVYKRSTVRASYAKDEEKKYNDRAIGAGFTQYGFGNALS